ncbi:hypothetical protein SAMN05660464_1986 [Geodermatophilus dictyosporus]|uniref:Uncharacterized protein n=1 Tax=Geodermatophilus dictyosporus TaxID=1523247 RepID=A0A1I5LZE9_9ACTN|nr:hypothetical protein [Geodermatophilus dictyosporus]SFP02121.1 hypothetical protein SAMN05660464_1986 [Geodermatophilus dictyosporus]
MTAVGATPSLLARRPAAPAEDGLGLADLLDLLGLDPAGDPPAPDRRPADPLGRVRTWVHRAADWGAGPQRSWCAW